MSDVGKKLIIIMLTFFIVGLSISEVFAGGGLPPIIVPRDQPTIQAAIDAFVEGEHSVIWVSSPKTYYEHDINFRGKAVTVKSTTDNPLECIINCGGNGSGAIFSSGEDENTKLRGITIINGNGDGAGIFCNGTSPVIENCIIENNTAYTYGGGIFCMDGSPSFERCIVKNNNSPSGGGVFLYSSSAKFDNCLFDNNTANYGATFYIIDSAPEISNCTLGKNIATPPGDGGSIRCSGSTSVIRNSIIWGNSTPLFVNDTCSYDITYSDISEIFPGEGNISSDPLFFDANNGDFRFDRSSPCTDAADPYFAPTKDLDNQMRPQCVDYDMGAFEAVDNSTDTDMDGLTDCAENKLCTDINLPDTDYDGSLDGNEDKNGNGVVESNESDPCDEDSDDDGMLDGWEIEYGLKPLIDDANEDPDGDLLLNIWEYGIGTDPSTNEENIDTDSDHLPDWWELTYFDGDTDLPHEPNDDSDGDLFSNHAEFVYGTDPSSSGDTPEAGFFYRYDNLGRLTAVLNMTTDATYYSIRYTYDAKGNRMGKTVYTTQP